MATKQPSTLIEALNAFQQKYHAAGLDGKNPFFKSKYTTLSQALLAVQPATEFGLCHTQLNDFVMTPDGEISYTRDGSFKKDANGRIVDKNGNRLVPEIIIPDNSIALEITPSGEVRSTQELNETPQVIGQIDIGIAFSTPSTVGTLTADIPSTLSIVAVASCVPPASYNVCLLYTSDAADE